MSKEKLKQNQRIFVSDCEGPISKNDNAFEMSTHFIPKGDHFFTLLSKYDDILADILKKTGYKSGDTLKLILPFLKAYDVTNNKIKEYSSKNILLISGAEDTLRLVKDVMSSFIVSTSYEQYIYSLCDIIGFPIRNVYCTRLDLDKYKIEKKEKAKLKEHKEEISTMPIMEIPEKADDIQQFSKKDQKNLIRLNDIFWKEIPKMECGKILKEVNPMGGYEKAKALHNIAERMKSTLQNIMYVGDSITDVSSFKLLRKSGGLTVSFNGNKYAVKEAEIAVLSENTIITSILAIIFHKEGKDGVLRLVKEWGYPSLRKYVDPNLLKNIIELFPTKLPKVEIVNDKNKDRLSMESSVFRKTVRGEKIGELG